MLNNQEGQEPQKNPDEETDQTLHTKPDSKPEEKRLSDEEIADLRRRAEVSSQNFERLKKLEADKKELEQRLSHYENNNPDLSTGEEDDVTDLKKRVTAMQKQLDKAAVLDAYPQLKAVWDDFERYHAEPENQGMNITTAAKVFVVEKNLTDTPQRIGLEKSRGGDRQPIPTGMSAEDIKKLRETDYKKYLDMVKKDKIKIQQ